MSGSTAGQLAEADALLAALDEQENAAIRRALVPVWGRGQLFARRRASWRLPALACGCHDPLSCLHLYGRDHAA
jgi:hypothetical protein